MEIPEKPANRTGHLGADAVPATLRVGARADLFAWKRGPLTADLDGVLR